MNLKKKDFYVCTVHLYTIKVYYSPTNAQVIVLKNSNIKIYIKIAPTCFGAVPTSSGRALSVLAKVTYLLTYLLHGAESRNSPPFLEPEGSSPYSQVPASCPYPEPTPSSPHNTLPLPQDPS